MSRTDWDGVSNHQSRSEVTLVVPEAIAVGDFNATGSRILGGVGAGGG